MFESVEEVYLEKGMEKGFDMGVEKGIDIGKEQGIDIGIEKTAKTMLASGKLSMKDIAEFTGLKMKRIRELADELKAV